MIRRVQEVMSVSASSAAAPDKGAAEQPSAAVKGIAEAPTQPAPAPSAKEQTIQEWRDEQTEIQKEEKQSINAVDEQELNLILQKLNELMSRINCNLQFHYHKDVDIMSVRMLDKATGEVIKEYPPEEMVENIEKAREWIGAFLDKNA